MLLMPTLGPRVGVMLEEDGDLGNPDTLVAANFFSLVCTLQIHFTPLSLRFPEKDLILATLRRYNT